ncbi:hypothetical protein [Streptomyces sp. NRRL S-337]|uniref:hypothetical protein n=1 Tax=Streptomyces sp. NRRL S-337 TaxID=1463900 RepID=UPI000AA2A78F|nr:hypothetical protein [Streptomyces sp. NRRL S-337]
MGNSEAEDAASVGISLPPAPACPFMVFAHAEPGDKEALQGQFSRIHVCRRFILLL